MPEAHWLQQNVRSSRLKVLKYVLEQNIMTDTKA